MPDEIWVAKPFPSYDRSVKIDREEQRHNWTDRVEQFEGPIAAVEEHEGGDERHDEQLTRVSRSRIQ
jgi:hypothetical protein